MLKHRAMVGFEMEVMASKVDKFGWHRDRGTAIAERLLTDWMDALQDYPLDEIQSACAYAIEENPSKMPHEGYVYKIIMRERAKVAALNSKQESKPKQERQAEPSEEEKQRVADYVAAAGFKPKRFGQ